MSGETRVELDLPTLIVTRFGHIEMDNGKSFESIIAQCFTDGDVISLHIVAEFTGLTRQFCEFKVRMGQFEHVCGKTMDDNNVCPQLTAHTKQLNDEAKASEEVTE